jgi:hypothetical protein
MDNPIRILIIIVSWKGNKDLWPEILNRGVDDFVILCGGNNNDPYLENHVIHLKCSDSYEGLPEKVICGIDFILNNSEFSSFTHFLKIDDHDTYVKKEDINNITSIHSSKLRDNDYVGQYIAYRPNVRYHFNRVGEDSYWYNREYRGNCEPFVPGYATYILSRHAMKCINNTFNLSNLNFVRRNFILEDVMIALILSACDIRPFDLKYGISYNIIHDVVNNVRGYWNKIGYEDNIISSKPGTLIRFGNETMWIQKTITVDKFKGTAEFFGFTTSPGKNQCPGVRNEIYEFVSK